ncbi:hypothetical protein [Apilactobacillus quenuiae]|uniref:hypothetical protein n=1 Tax=Apilactobacillus quenuiae TaxID=2008377 RepID=UPI0013000120|nr:hypothetical protein [Apilactobacillus quenuiae]
MNQIINSFQEEDRKRLLEYLSSQRRSSILGMTVGMIIGIYIAIITFSSSDKLPVYFICIILVFFILVLDVILIILSIHFKNHNKFMGIHLDKMYKRNKIYNLYPYLAWIIFHAYLISTCYSIYIMYK